MINKEILPQLEGFTRGTCAALDIDDSVLSVSTAELGDWLKPHVYVEITQLASTLMVRALTPEDLLSNCEQVREYYCEDVARAMALVADEWARLLQGYGRAG